MSFSDFKLKTADFTPELAACQHWGLKVAEGFGERWEKTSLSQHGTFPPVALLLVSLVQIPQPDFLDFQLRLSKKQFKGYMDFKKYLQRADILKHFL